MLDYIKEKWRTLRRLDPDCDIFFNSLENVVACALGAFFWLFFRPPGSSLLVLSPGFIVMVGHSFPKWNDKVRSMAYAALLVAVCQFGVSVLFNCKILILVWLFSVTFFSFSFKRFRFASAMALGISMLSLSMGQVNDWHAGMNRNIDEFFAFLISLSVLIIFSIFTSRMQIRLALSGFLSELKDCIDAHAGRPGKFVKIYENDEDMLLDSRERALRAHFLIHEEDYLTLKEANFVAEAAKLQVHLNSISRASSFLKGLEKNPGLLYNAASGTDEVLVDISARLSELENCVRFSRVCKSENKSRLYERWRKQWESEKLPLKFKRMLYGLQCIDRDISALESILKKKALK